MWRSNLFQVKKQGIFRGIRSLQTSLKKEARAMPDQARRIDKDLRQGMEIDGFVVTDVGSVPEFNLTALRLRHQKTGAQYLHLLRDDSNNAFCVGFRTTPTDSTGLPHILEHTTLCGSQRYPCRDPFFKMLNRSMATFMNAMTGPDYTIYPFSTQNRTDYYNLMSVYLDAVFRPQLRETDFKQEGWRLEHENIHDQCTPITFKGVVFNEMKGAFSDNHSIFSEALLNNILPSGTYGVVSGGDPHSIPNLTYQDLKAFHKKYYHPSNCRFYSYGNFPLREHLHYINRVYLHDNVDNNDYAKATVVPAELRWNSERVKNISCRYDPLAPNPKKQSSIAIANLCNDIKSTQETFVMQVLSELLVRGPNSAFYKTLVEPNIGGGFSPVTGYDSQTRDTIFSVGLQGVNPEDFEKIVEIYNQTVDNVINEGFDENNIKAILHNIELNIKHQTADFGLSMLFGITPLWNHDGDIVKGIRVNDHVLKLKKAMADNPMYLQDCVQEYLKDNKHRLILTMTPDEGYEVKQAEIENELLKKKLSVLSPQQTEHVFVQGQELLKEQEAKQDVTCLPTLTISDLNPDVERVHLKGYALHNVPLQVCHASTNGLTYFRGVLNTSILSEEAKRLLPLFCNILTKMGSKSHDYRQMDQMIQLKTGGLNVSTHVAENIFDLNSFEEGISFSSFCLDRNVKAMLNLWNEMFNECDLRNEKRFETLVKVCAADLANGIAQNGHAYAMSQAAAMVCASARRKEQFGGLSFVKLMKQLTQGADMSETLEMIQGIAEVTLKKGHLRLALNLAQETEEKTIQGVGRLLESMKGEYKRALVLSSSEPNMPGHSAIHHIVNIPVSHTALCVPTVHYTHSDFPALRVLARLLTSKYLLPRIREKGGAYGSGANVTTHGVFAFYSYRDPNPCNSFDTYDEAQDWALNSDYSEEDVEEAKLGIFQSIDAPIPPGSLGIRNFFYGISDDELQRHRQVIMRIRREDLVRVASYLNSARQGRSLIGPENPDLVRREGENWEVRRTE